MLCDHHIELPRQQMGKTNTAISSTSEWTQRMMMMIPATNSSSNTTAAATTTTTVTAPASSSAMASKAGVVGGPLRCPRCDSSNTKFCYYNNYSLSQPRHFCKACKRYWTRGGTLRNVPVGGGCRKNKRAKKHNTSSSAAAASAPKAGPTPVSTAATASSDLSSFLYAPSSNCEMNNNLSYFYNDSLGGFGGLIPNSNPLLAGTSLADLQQQQQPAVAASYLDGSSYSSILQQQQQTNLGFLKDVKLEGDNNFNLVSSEWGGNYHYESGDASCLQYWNPAVGAPGAWPDAANPSLAPLI